MRDKTLPDYASSWDWKIFYRLLVICVFCMVIPSLTREIIYSGVQLEKAKFVSRFVGYVLLLIFCIKYGKLSKSDVVNMLSSRRIFEIAVACNIGIFLFGFCVGENAFEVFIASTFSAERAYSMWPFHEDFSIEKTSPSLYLFVLATVMAPFAEEFYFRGLLFISLAKSRALAAAIILDSLIFAAFHPQHMHIIGTLVFSSVLCYVYLKTFSLWLCIVAHSTFNLADLIVENYGREFLVRSQEQLGSTAEWRGIFIAFITSTLAIALVLIKIARLPAPASPLERKLLQIQVPKL